MTYPARAGTTAKSTALGALDMISNPGTSEWHIDSLSVLIRPHPYDKLRLQLNKPFRMMYVDGIRIQDNRLCIMPRKGTNIFWDIEEEQK